MSLSFFIGVTMYYICYSYQNAKQKIAHKLSEIHPFQWVLNLISADSNQKNISIISWQELSQDDIDLYNLIYPADQESS
jgi:hypothetical protein